MFHLYRGTTVKEAMSDTVGRHWTDSLLTAIDFAFSPTGTGYLLDDGKYATEPRNCMYMVDGKWHYKPSPDAIAGAIIEADVPEELVEWRYSEEDRERESGRNPYGENEYYLKAKYNDFKTQMEWRSSGLPMERITKIHVFNLKRVGERFGEEGCHGYYEPYSHTAFTPDGKLVSPTFQRSVGVVERRKTLSFLAKPRQEWRRRKDTGQAFRVKPNA
jgi:hypothetical protein